MENQLISVSDFIALANQTFEYAYPTVAIEGEVSSFKVNSGKYVFFDLKDNESSLNCFMSIWQLRLPIEDGMKVIVIASPKLTKWGKFSLTVQTIKPSGEGSLKKSFELLKDKLSKEGIFDEQRKRTLPYPPGYIGVISSIQAAGYADFIKILNERWGGVKVETANVQVQGDSSADQIIAAIKYFNSLPKMPDVIAIVRGGGSADDLSVFNDELLVREIASSRIPTILGVGHEVDESLADLAADKSASTPSNAAQMLVPDRIDAAKNLQYKFEKLSLNLLNKIESVEMSNTGLLQRALDIIENKLEILEDKMLSTNAVLSAINPINVLERGYAIIRGRVVENEIINIETSKHKFSAEVKEIYE